MKIFKRNKNGKATGTAAGYIANGILKLQNKFANLMGKLSVGWKRKQQLIFFYLICVSLGGLSILAIIKPFGQKLSRPAAIKFPLKIHPDQPVKITDTEFSKVKAFLDSSKLLEKRPGLKDSLEMVKELYYSQKK